MDKRLILVTGGNRGLGLETCRELAKAGHEVILTSRDAKKGEEQVKALRAEGGTLHFLSLDIADSGSIQALVKQIQQKWGRLDVLINNAGILLDKDAKKSPEAHRQLLEETLTTNVVGTYELCDRLAPLMKEKGYGRIVNVSSGLGQLSEPHSEYAAYSISKTALNAVTVVFANQYQGTNVLINSVCPGWVKTDMGGESAPRSLQEGVSGIIWAATLPDQGPTGKFFRDGKPINW
jgi:NAD(P)-dependent dehydrogenase (short-subunit alcohol dehydrogenase family)